MTQWISAKRNLDRPAVGGPADVSAPLDAILGHRPELRDGYRSFYRSIWEAGLVSHRLLELCRLRIAAIHGCPAEWAERDNTVTLTHAELDALERGDCTPFNESEAAALAVAERMPYQHHQITDEEVLAVKTLLGAPGCVSLMNAMVLFDANCRLLLTFGGGGPEEKGKRE